MTFSEEITVSPAVAYAIRRYNVPVYRFFKAVMDVTVDGHDDVLSDNDYISGNELWLQLSFAVSGHQELRVSYDNIFAENGGGILVDAAGNAVPFFSDQAVQNDARIYPRPDRAPVFELSTEDLTIAEGGSATYTVSLVSQPSEGRHHHSGSVPDRAVSARQFDVHPGELEHAPNGDGIHLRG